MSYLFQINQLALSECSTSGRQCAGLRVYDIRDPRTPNEIAYFIPPDPKVRIGTKPSKLVEQTEDVLVDRRGFIYISQKNQGIYILKLKEIWPNASARAVD